jgi:hypothetical protein
METTIEIALAARIATISPATNIIVVIPKLFLLGISITGYPLLENSVFKMSHYGYSLISERFSRLQSLSECFFYAIPALHL